VVFSAAYLLVAVQRVFFNPITHPENQGLPDATPRELAVLIPLLAAMLWMGLYPQPILRRTEAAARRYVETVRPYLPASTAGAIEAAR
jgi:NADH-quinone oxidoreductase subunit M